MSENSKKANFDDYLLVEYQGETGRAKLNSFDKILVLLNDIGSVEDLEAEIDELKTELTELSSDFAAEHETISEIDKVYERKSVTDYMAINPEILNSTIIKKIIADANIVTITETDKLYSKEDSKSSIMFSKTISNVDKWING